MTETLPKALAAPGFWMDETKLPL